MTGAISHIALYAPIAASSGIFAFRRAERGIDNIDENPLFGTANLFIAGGQIFKGIESAQQIIAKKAPVTGRSSKAIEAIGKNIENATSSSKTLIRFSKIFKTASNFINPMICVASLIKVLGSDDKADAAVREALGLGMMFSCEAGAKALLGMPKTEIKNGIKTTLPRESLIKNLFNEGQTKAMKDFAASSKFISKISKSPISSTAKGVLFVLASIGGYKLGSKLADWALGKSESKPAKKHNK